MRRHFLVLLGTILGLTIPQAVAWRRGPALNCHHRARLPYHRGLSIRDTSPSPGQYRNGSLSKIEAGGDRHCPWCYSDILRVPNLPASFVRTCNLVVWRTIDDKSITSEFIEVSVLSHDYKELRGIKVRVPWGNETIIDIGLVEPYKWGTGRIMVKPKKGVGATKGYVVTTMTSVAMEPATTIPPTTPLTSSSTLANRSSTVTTAATPIQMSTSESDIIVYCNSTATSYVTLSFTPGTKTETHSVATSSTTIAPRELAESGSFLAAIIETIPTDGTDIETTLVLPASAETNLVTRIIHKQARGFLPHQNYYGDGWREGRDADATTSTSTTNTPPPGPTPTTTSTPTTSTTSISTTTPAVGPLPTT
ncbi:hypothetical protein V8F06_014284 [Rhypophila decipiens]